MIEFGTTVRDKDDVQAGDIVSIPFGGVLTHYGVVTHRGTVISNSRAHGGVVEQSLAEFANGKRVTRRNGDSGLHALEVEARARRVMGADYDLAASNCGHFVRWAHRRKPTATQVGAATLKTIGDMVFGGRRR